MTEALEADPTTRARLRREARAAAALDHPYICKIHEVAEVDGRTSIVMEHVSGETLQATLGRGPVPPRKALQIASEIAEALDEAHRQQFVHRDLKPANVMLSNQVIVQVMKDGGIVGFVASGLIEMAAGIAAACGARWEAAEPHFETALRQAPEIPHRIAEPNVRRWYAWLLLNRDAPGDRDKAHRLLAEAIELYRTFGMPKHVDIAETMLNQ